MKVSVIIPFYDLERYARECLDSVLAAVKGREDRVEVICVDDGSTDSTPGILDEYASRYPFVKAVHKPNGGEGSARNAGLAAASGEWITFLDGDDLWLVPVLSEFFSAGMRHPDVDIIGFRYLPFDDGAAVPAPLVSSSETVYDVCREIPTAAIVDLGVFPTFFRRKKFAGILFTRLPLGADRLYVAECLARADRIVMSASAVHGYRVRADSMAHSVWNERKLVSMIDFIVGSLNALHAVGKRIERGGIVYLAHALLGWAAKYTARLADGRERKAVSRRLAEAIRGLDSRQLPLAYRLRRRMYLMSHSKPRIEDR